jgi:hypothetical protein
MTAGGSSKAMKVRMVPDMLIFYVNLFSNYCWTHAEMKYLGPLHMSGKFKIRNPKFETNLKSEYSNDQNKYSLHHHSTFVPVWVI